MAIDHSLMPLTRRFFLMNDIKFHRQPTEPPGDAESRRRSLQLRIRQFTTDLATLDNPPTPGQLAAFARKFGPSSDATRRPGR